MDIRSNIWNWQHDPLAPLDGLERTFGAVSDALGLGPTRQLQRALTDLLTAAGEAQRAQIALMMQLGSAWPRIGCSIVQNLHKEGVRGEVPERLVDLGRQWTAAADEVFHELLQTESALQGVAACVRAATQLRLQLDRVVEIASQSCNVPTRAEIDDAFREIQHLKRKVRRLEREPQAPAGTVQARPRRAGPDRKDAP